MPAAAERNGLAPAQTKRFAVHVEKFDFPFDAQWTVIPDRNFCGWHASPSAIERVASD
jgi:hypothetical protein